MYNGRSTESPDTFKTFNSNRMSLVNTLMQPLRAEYPSNLDKNEIRQSRYGAWEFFQQDSAAPSSIFSQNTKALIKESIDQTLQIPVLDAEEVTISETRSCTIADKENTSQLVTLTFATYSFGFTMTPSQHKNNEISYQADFNRKLLKYLIKFASVLDAQAIATLEAAKNQVFTGLTDFYPETGNSLQVADDEKNDFYNRLETMMNLMDFYGNTKVITSTSGKPMVARLNAQGQQNSVNEAFQLGGYEWFYTNRIANGSGVASTLYAVQEGTVATENRNDVDAIMGARVGDYKEWGLVNVPIVNLEMASFYIKDCADRSALHSGMTSKSRTLVEGFEWSTDIVFATAYNSDPTSRYNPVLKAEIASPS